MAFYYKQPGDTSEVTSSPSVWTEGNHTAEFWEGSFEGSGGSGGSDGSGLACNVASGYVKEFIAGVKTFSEGLNVSAGGTFEVRDKKTDGYAPILTFDSAAVLEQNAGLYVLSGGQLILNAPDASNYNGGIIDVDGGELTISHGIRNHVSGNSSTAGGGNIYVKGGGAITVEGTLTNPGHIDLLSSSVASMTGTMENSGEVGVNDATLNFSGTWTNASGGDFDIENGGSALMAGTMVNSGEVGVNDATLTFLNGSWTNAAGGKLEIDDYAVVSMTDTMVNSGIVGVDDGTLNFSGTWTNAGSGQLDIDEFGSALMAGTMVNSGEVGVNDGELNFNGTWTNAAGGQLEIQKDAVASMSGTMTNSGTVGVNDATLDFIGPWTNAESGELTITHGGSASVGSMTNLGIAKVIDGGTLNINSTWTGNLALGKGAVVNVASGATIDGALSMFADSQLNWNSSADALLSTSITIDIWSGGDGPKKVIDLPDGVTSDYANEVYDNKVTNYNFYINQGRLWVDENGDLWNMTASPKILYVNDTYSGNTSDPVGNGKYLYGINAFKTFYDEDDTVGAVTKAAELQTVEEYDITGGSLTSSVYANGKKLKIIGGVSGSGAYVYGGASDSATSGNVEIDAAEVQLKAVVGGASVVVTSATTDLTVGLIAGGNKITTGSTVTGDTSVKINGDVTVSDFTMAGSFQTGETAVTVGGNSELKIAAGTYGSIQSDGMVTGVVTGGGLLQNSADASKGAYTQTGSVNVTISGGTINTVLFAAGASRKKVGEEQMKVTGNVNVTIDCSSKSVSLYEVYAGFNGDGIIGGNATMTFTGKGENLTFTKVAGKRYNGVFGDNGGKEGVTGTSTLVFDDFKGNFTANNIKKFKAIEFSNESQVTFTQSGLNLSAVKEWRFGYNTSLEWTGAFVFNDLGGDTLAFGTSDDLNKLTGAWEVMTASDPNAFFGWGDANNVSIFGIAASFGNNVWTTTDNRYQLACIEENNTKKLVVSLA